MDTDTRVGTAPAHPIGVGLVGTGIMGRRMLAALQAHPRFQATALWDPNEQALQTTVAATPGAHAAASLQALVSNPAVRLVYVASPPAHHLAGVQAALAAGKACLCEKPLASGLVEAQALHDAVQAAGLPFAVNFPFASAAASLGLLAQVQSGRLGTLQSARITLRFAQWPRPWQAGASAWLAGPAEGGFTREVLSHFIFLAHRLFGPAQVLGVELQRAEGQAETALRARLQHAGVVLHIDAAVAGEVADHNRFEVVGSHGSAALQNWSSLTVDGVEVLPRQDSTPSTLDRLAAWLSGELPANAPHGLASAQEALAVVACVETLLQAQPG